MSNRKSIRFEITSMDFGPESDWLEDSNDCIMVLEIPNKYIDGLIKQLLLTQQFEKVNPSPPDSLLCMCVGGKPRPQIYRDKDGNETRREDSFLSDEFNKVK